MEIINSDFSNFVTNFTDMATITINERTIKGKSLKLTIIL